MGLPREWTKQRDRETDRVGASRAKEYNAIPSGSIGLQRSSHRSPRGLRATLHKQEQRHSARVCRESRETERQRDKQSGSQSSQGVQRHPVWLDRSPAELAPLARGLPWFNPHTKNASCGGVENDKETRDGRWMRVFFACVEYAKGTGDVMYSLYIPSVGLSEMQKAEARIVKMMGLRVVRLTLRGEAPQAALAGDHVKLTPRRAQTAQQRASEASELKHRAVGAVLMTMAEAGGISPLVTMAREGTMEQK